MRSHIPTVARGCGWLLLVIIVILSFVPAEYRPQTEAPHNFEHFGIFFATGIAFGAGYSRSPALFSIALIVFAGAVELGQNLVPGRHARWSDFVVDAIAVAIGTIVASFVMARTFERGPSGQI
jgi:VanZ family protein